MAAWRRLLITVVVLIFSACGGDTDETPPVTETDASTSADGDTGVCENPCLNEFGKNDKKLCPDPKSEWTCTGGCCIPVFKCVTDEDCAEQGFSEGQCTDERFGCRCETGSGVCFPWYCAVDSECAEGESCDGGSCVEGPSADALAPRILSGPRVLTPEATGQMVADAWDSSTGLASPETPVQWSSSAPDVVAVTDGGEATGGSSAGEATLTAKVGDEEATWTLRNIVPDPSASVTVIAIVAGTSDPVAGEYAAVDGASGELLTSGPIPADGVIEATTDGDAGIDVHLFGQGTDWVSWLRGDGVVLMPVPRTAWGEISLDPTDEPQADGTELEGMNIVSGEVSFGDYPKQGELELTLNSFPLGNGLFDFSLETLLGPEVSRYFDPGHSLPGVDTDEVAQIPGGLTFSLSTPAILTYQLGAQPGDRRVWSVGGRISLEEISEYADLLFAAFDDGLDFNLLVGTLFPTFADFWSAVTPIQEVAGDGSLDATKAPVTLAYPLPLRTLLTPSALPPLVRDADVPGVCSGEEAIACSGDEDCGEESTCEGIKAAGSLGWANALFMLNGAITGDALMIPLGINAGSDTSDPELNPEDGIADADETTPEPDPYVVPGASLHSGLAGPHTRYGLAVVAASIRSDNDDPRPEGGSAVVHRYEPGEGPAESLTLPSFLEFPVNSTWSPTDRKISVEPVDGADTQRVLFKGGRGHHWTIWLGGLESYTVPQKSDLVDGAEEEEAEDRAVDTQLVLVNSFDFSEGIGLEDLVSPSGTSLNELLLTVDRASFVDIK